MWSFPSMVFTGRISPRLDRLGPGGLILLLVLLSSAVCVLATATASRASFPSLRDVTLEQLQRGLQQGCFSSTDLVQAYLERIRQVNGQVKAVTEVNPDALHIAKRLDHERARNAVRGPLHGVPILLKNNIATGDKMGNTAGSLSLVGATVPRDSTIARKLREAGAIILGKSNLSQWANYRSYNSTNGWSATDGQVYAAYHAKQDPGGSSSGSGVATDLGLGFAAVGTETSGSILIPAQCNNVVGIKPTVGLTSRYLVIPVSEHHDTVGPMARTVRDAAHLLQAMAGRDARDNYTAVIPSVPDYAAACKDGALAGARIGVPWNVVLPADAGDRLSPPELDAFRASLDVLRDAGAVIVEANLTRDTSPEGLRDRDTVLEADFVANLASYLAELTSNPHGMHTLAQVRDFTRKTPAERYPDRNTGRWDPILDEPGFDNTDPRCWAAYRRVLRSELAGGVLGALRRHRLGAVVLPTSLAPGWISAVGAPGVTVPMGHFPASTQVVTEPRGELVVVGPAVPFGLSFLGRRWSEARLIALAYGFEQRTRVRGRVRPLVMPEAEVAVSAACQRPRADGASV